MLLLLKIAFDLLEIAVTRKKILMANYCRCRCANPYYPERIQHGAYSGDALVYIVSFQKFLLLLSCIFFHRRS